MQQLVTDNGKNKALRVIGLANDQIGYIIPDSNFMPMLARNPVNLDGQLQRAYLRA